MKIRFYLQIFILMLLLILAFLLFNGCTDPSGRSGDEVKQDTAAFVDALSPDERQKQYQSLRSHISSQQKKLAQKGSVDKAKTFLLRTLTDSIFPHWYETALGL